MMQAENNSTCTQAIAPRRALYQGSALYEISDGAVNFDLIQDSVEWLESALEILEQSATLAHEENKKEVELMIRGAAALVRLSFGAITQCC